MLQARSILILLLLPALALSACLPKEVYDDTNNLCYAYFNYLTTQADSEKECARLNYSPVSIHGGFQNQIIAAYATSHFGQTYTDFWLGMKLIMNNWSWVDGTKFDFNQWDAGQSKKKSGTSFIIGQPLRDRSCASVQVADAKWSSRYCTEYKPFVCARPANAIPTTTQDPCSAKYQQNSCSLQMVELYDNVVKRSLKK